MSKAHVVFDKAFTVGQVDERLKGSFVEHIGRCMYGGLYQPEHPTADANGFRGDVKELMRELGVRIIRYPGGNFVSGYHWKNGVGPKEKRPAVRDMAWHVTETNQVGTDEFATLMEELEIELMMAANLGTGTPQDAADLVEYCVQPGGTQWSDARKSNGHEAPYDIKVWCLGNEMDGEWQIGALSAADYAAKAREAGKMVRWMQPEARLVVCGSCTNEADHASFGEWDGTVLEAMYDQIDYLSLHRYYSYHPEKQMFYKMHEDEGDIPYIFTDLREYITTIVGACDFVKGKLRKEKTVNISFDEWGLVLPAGVVPGDADGASRALATPSFSLIDAVIYGGMLCVFLNHADRVKIACQSLLINEGGMITTGPHGPALRQATFFPFRDFAQLAGGVALQPAAQLPRRHTTHHGDQETMTVAACYDENTGSLNVFVMNCDTQEDAELHLELRAFGSVKAVEHRRLYHEDMHAANTFETPECVQPETLPLEDPVDGSLHLKIKKHSWNVFCFQA